MFPGPSPLLYLLKAETKIIALTHHYSYSDRQLSVGNLVLDYISSTPCHTLSHIFHLQALSKSTLQYSSLVHGAIATKGHNNDLLISLTSLVEIRTDPHKYLLIIQHIEAVTKGTLDILECSWMPYSSFCRAYTCL
jgi:hypothetical protein